MTAVSDSLMTSLVVFSGVVTGVAACVVVVAWALAAVDGWRIARRRWRRG